MTSQFERSATGRSYDISVIVPVYNVITYLRECLDSLVDQELDGLSMQVVTVDDGSTDGSGEVLDEYAAEHEFIHVIHQENSGWPGRPRNRGLDIAAGRYILFCDPDDYLGSQALRRMVRFADVFDVDVLFPKLVGINGRYIKSSIYKETQVDADLFLASTSTNVVKMIRSTLIADNNIRFEEGRVLMEDAMVIFKAMTCARRVSILADYDYYYVRLREDGSNISYRPTDPYEYAASMTKVMSTIRGGFDNPHLEQKMIVELFRRIGLNKYDAKRYGDKANERIAALVDAHGPVVDEFIPQGAELALAFPARERLALIRERRVNDLIQMSRFAPEAPLSARLLNLSSIGAEIRFEISASLEGTFRRISTAVLEVRSRDGKEFWSSNCELVRADDGNGTLSIAPQSNVLVATIEMNAFSQSRATYDFHLTVCSGGRIVTSRLYGGDPGSDAEARLTTQGFYFTRWGNLSWSKGLPAPDSGKRSLKSVVRRAAAVINSDRRG